MSTAAHSLGFTGIRHARTLRKLPAFRFDRARVSAGLGLATLALIGVYVVLVNMITSTRLQLDSLSVAARELKEENHRLQLLVAQGQSVQGADRAAQLLGLTPVAHTEYLTGSAGTVAVSQ
jgi:hypothetical protein